jgi:hypothetical protein
LVSVTKAYCYYKDEDILSLLQFSKKKSYIN